MKALTFDIKRRAAATAAHSRTTSALTDVVDRFIERRFNTPHARAVQDVRLRDGVVTIIAATKSWAQDIFFEKDAILQDLHREGQRNIRVVNVI